MTTNAIIRVHQHGGPDCLKLDELALEPLQPEHLLVEVQAAGVNFFDTQLRSGLYKQPLPIALGNEGAGIVREVGPGAAGFKAGDRVAWVQSAGSYARWKNIAADQVFLLPVGVSCEAAAATLFQGMTAHYLACSTHPLAPGESCVIHSAAGGVGLLLTRIAKMRGATVIAAVSTKAKAEVAAANGADHVVVYADGDLADVAKRATGGRGVDVVYDSVGGDVFHVSRRVLAREGRLLVVGFASGELASTPTNHALYRNYDIVGVYFGGYSGPADAEWRRQIWEDVLDHLRAGRLRPVMDRVLALTDDIPAALTDLAERRTVGKVVIDLLSAK
jgi:NADPH2:quinone reductase